ncbi:MAG: hypothetical protein HQL59_07745 [Magnetococcales bacterium]|nr:hypothetical protein [Magnetococcales bacterium]
MKQRGMAVKRGATLLSLAGAVALGFGLMACGGGGGGGSSSSSDISGDAIKGPVKRATVSSSSGTVSSGNETGDTGSFSAKLTGATAPYILTFTGGTDTVTNATPSFPVSTLVSTSATTRANALPQTTMIVQTIKKLGGATTITSAMVTSYLTTATSNIMSVFGGGMSSSVGGFDPFTSVIGTGGADLATVVLAAENVGETIRRSTSTLVSKGANAATATVTDLYDDVLLLLAEDATDGELDGKAKDGTGASANLDSTMMTAVGYTASTALNQAQFALQAKSQAAAVAQLVMTGSDFIGNGTIATSLLATRVSGITAAGITTATNTVSADGKFVQFVNNAATASCQSDGVSTTATVNAMCQFAAAVNTAAASITSGGVVSSAALTTLAAAVTSANIGNVATQAATLATTIAATTAGNIANLTNAISAGTAVSSFKLGTNNLVVTDYNAAGVSSSQTVAGTTASGVMTASPTTALSAANLTLLANGTGGTPPTIGFTLGTLPVRGTSASKESAVVTMTLLDGSDATRSTSERYMTVTFPVSYYSNGTTLTLSAPTTAAVSYKVQGSDTASTATLSNATTSGMIAVTTAGGGPATSTVLTTRIPKLFSLISSLNSAATAGTYYYQISITGLPLVDSASAPFSTIQGTFTVS